MNGRLLTPDETAEFLTIQVTTLKKWRTRGEGPPFVKIGASVRYRESALQAWLDERTVDPAVAS